LAFRNDSEPVVSDLSALASLANQNPPRTLAESESRRIAARATAALARARLAQGIEVESMLTGIPGSTLPSWERAYLRGLGSWQDGDISGAISHLQSALEHNPHQTSIRLAIASLRASQSLEAALSVLEYPEPTREMWNARAALLARLERYAEAEDALRHCSPESTVASEPERYSWSRGRVQSRRREAALCTGLAERRRDWEMASKSWLAVSAGRRTLQETRQLFAARQELESLPAGKSWRRDVLRQRLERGRTELGNIPLVGDALFFRANAMQAMQPDRAIKDFETLLRRRAWVEAECRVGGGRIVYVADALLRAGRVDDAIRGYELVRASRGTEVDERLAVALVLKEILHHAEASAITRAAERATVLAPTGPWPQLLAALGLLIMGDVSSARSRLDVAETRGAPEGVCRCLRSTCAVASSGTATLTDEELNTLPGEVGAVVRFLCGAEPETARIKKYANKLGETWLAHCPTDPSLTARRFLAILFDEGRWEEVMRFADILARSEQPWAKDLAALARVRHALHSADRGDLKQAEMELEKV
jgi:tetratricopeptide (TPR) repeat protein